MKLKFRLRPQKIVALLLLVTFTLQSVAAFAATTADAAADAAQKPTVSEVNNVTVVDIAAPNDKGLSHNRYTEFNVHQNGLILNNALQATNTTLAGNLQANANFKGTAATLILNEVTGPNRTYLNGTLEVAGAKAAVIIANPNGITGDNFGFINTSRVSLVTGTPYIDESGNLTSFHVNSGDVQLQGSGINEDYPATKLDIMTRAAQINAAVWADEINVVTGNNQIDYQTLTPTPIEAGSAPKPAVALDVGALGGMYAGKIILVGTEKGLGVTIDGDVSAAKGLTLTHDGKITVNGSLNAKEDIRITASGDLVNNGQISSNQNIRIAANHIDSSGFISAGEEEGEEEEEHEAGGSHTGSTPVLADLTITATETIDVSGLLSASRDITLSGKKATYDANNVLAQNVTVHQSEPDPAEEPENPAEEPKEPEENQPGEEPKNEVITTIIQPAMPDLPDLPAGSSTPTQPVAKEANLPLTADASAPGEYKPVIDKAANGVDLVQIATASAGGVSRNLYTDFNINPGGLILNNAIEYTNTQLGGYIDYNHRLNGISAKVILNEVTSANITKLNGYLEVAGAKASVVIANANGISVNGFGYINAADVTLSTATVSNWQNGQVEFNPVATGDIVLQGDGLNAKTTDHLHIIANNFTNTASELWASQLSLSANGNIYNSGKIIATGHAQITGQNLTNEAHGVIDSAGELAISVQEGIVNQTAAIQSGGQTTITGQSLENEQNALLYSAGNLTVTVDDIKNQTATMAATGKTTLTGRSFENTANALLYSGSDLTITATRDINNQTSTVKSGGTTLITGETFKNQQGAYFLSENTLEIHANHSVLNQGSTLNSQAATTITTQEAVNRDGAVLASEGNLTIQAETYLQNQASAIQTNGDLSVNTQALANQENALIMSAGNSQLEVDNDLVNQTSAIKSGGTLTATAENFTSRDQAVISAGKGLNLTTTADIVHENSTLESNGPTQISSQNFTNANSYLGSAGDLELKATGTIRNQNAEIAVAGNSDISAQNFTNEANSAIFTTGDFTLTTTNKLTNRNSVLAANGTTQITAADIHNLDGSMLYGTGDLTLTANNNILNQSSDIESQGSIQITANKLTNEKTVFETDWAIQNKTVSYAITPKAGHYSATRKFAREIKTGTIRQETAAAQILAGKDITINATVINHYSTIAAGRDLTIDAPYLENYGYQGTVITTDKGSDTHRWKYKKHTTAHLHCHWRYGTTVVPYNDQTVVDTQTTRPGILSAVNKVTIHAGTISNKTFDAGKNVIETKTQDVTQPNILNQLTGNTKATSQVDPQVNAAAGAVTIGSLAINTKLFTINTDPAAKYLIETNEKFAGYQNFLSSDYLLERVKTDPSKVTKRLGDGYYEQKLVTDQITELTGQKFLNDYSSELEQYKALMENAATFAAEYNLTIGVALTKEQMAQLTSDIVWLVAEEVNGEKVLVPEVYLSMLREGDLTASGAIITGTDVEIIASDDLKNIGTIKANQSLTIDAQNITNENGSISGGDVSLTARDTVANQSATITGTNVTINSDNIISQTNTRTDSYRELEQTKILDTASITAQNNLTLNAQDSIKNQGASLSAGKELVLTAKKDIDIESVSQERHVAVSYSESSLEEYARTHQGSLLAGQTVTIHGDNVNVKGSIVAAEDTVNLTADSSVSITADKDINQSDVSVGSRSGYYFDRQQESHETVVGSTIAAGKDIEINSKQDIEIKGSNVTSEAGKITLDAKENVTITHETEHHESLHEEHREDTGILSSTKTDIYDHQRLDAVVGSSISGNELTVKAGQDATIKGSTAVADKDVTITAKENINMEAAEETSESEYEKSVKKSGMFTSSGLGVTIGTQKQKDTLANQNAEQVAATLGSLEGSIRLEAGKDVTIQASDVIAKKDIDITGGNVRIESADNTYNAQEKHEFKQSGLTLSLESQTLNAVNQVYQPLKRASEVSDDRLAALYGYKAEQEYEKIQAEEKAKAKAKAKAEAEAAKQNGQTDTPQGQTGAGANTPPKESDFSISISLGSSKSETTATSQTTIAQGSNISADGNVTIKATAGDIKVRGSEIEGQNVDLDATENIEIIASENKNTSNSDSQSSSASVGVSINLGTGNLGGLNASASKQNGEIKENSITYNQSSITAEGTLNLKSGQDIDIIGSKATGETVTINAGGDLNIESLQDQESYDKKNSSAGGTIGAGGVNASASKGKINSDYASVTEQAGIYAGEGGFTIEVGSNTDLKGAAIGSEATPDKNRLSTGTITFSDIENKAEYKAESNGVGYATGTGWSPNMGVPVSDDKTSTTHAAIAQGTIEIKDQANQKADITKLSRDTQNAVNKLDQIFDKKTVQEKQELANLFSQEAVKLVGDIAEREKDRLTNKIATAKTEQEREAAKNEYQLWMEGGTNKVLLHTLVGGLTAQLGGGSFMSGAAGAGFNEIVQQELKNIKDPTLHQLASTLVGSAAAEVLGGDAQTGAVTALNGTKYNFLSHWQTKERDKAILNEDWDAVAYWARIDKAQNQICNSMGINPNEIDWEDPKNAKLLYTVSMQAQQLEADPDFRNSWLVNSPTVDSSTLISAGVVGTAIVVAGVTLYKYNGGWVRAATGTGAIVPFKSQELINELAKSGVKYTPENVVAITRTANGNLVWLETGNAQAGLQHIMRHADDFAAKGIANNQISDLVMTALNRGQIVAYQGQGTGRPIYEVMFNGVKQHVAITVGNNGFIVGANPISLP